MILFLKGWVKHLLDAIGAADPRDVADVADAFDASGVCQQLSLSSGSVFVASFGRLKEREPVPGEVQYSLNGNDVAKLWKEHLGASPIHLEANLWPGHSVCALNLVLLDNFSPKVVSV